MYVQAEEEWQKQLHFIAETKKIRNEDRDIKMMHKNDTEKIIEKAMKEYGKKEKKFVKKESPKKTDK